MILNLTNDCSRHSFVFFFPNDCYECPVAIFLGYFMVVFKLPSISFYDSIKEQLINSDQKCQIWGSKNMNCLKSTKYEKLFSILSSCWVMTSLRKYSWAEKRRFDEIFRFLRWWELCCAGHRDQGNCHLQSGGDALLAWNISLQPEMSSYLVSYHGYHKVRWNIFADFCKIDIKVADIDTANDSFICFSSANWFYW